MSYQYSEVERKLYYIMEGNQYVRFLEDRIVLNIENYLGRVVKIESKEILKNQDGDNISIEAVEGSGNEDRNGRIRHKTTTQTFQILKNYEPVLIDVNYENLKICDITSHFVLSYDEKIKGDTYKLWRRRPGHFLDIQEGVKNLSKIVNFKSKFIKQHKVLELRLSDSKVDYYLLDENKAVIKGYNEEYLKILENDISTTTTNTNNTKERSKNSPKKLSQSSKIGSSKIGLLKVKDKKLLAIKLSNNHIDILSLNTKIMIKMIRNNHFKLTNDEYIENIIFKILESERIVEVCYFLSKNNLCNYLKSSYLSIIEEGGIFIENCENNLDNLMNYR